MKKSLSIVFILIGTIVSLSAELTLEEKMTACNDGNSSICYSAAMHYSHVTENADDVLILKLFTKGCEGGDMESCIIQGEFYEEGRTIDINYTKARNLYEKACLKNNDTGCYRLGSMYFKGHGMKQSYAAAKKIYSETCDKGFLYACSSVAEMYSNGHGVQQSYATAKKIYADTCDKGLNVACISLGDMYYNGQGITQSYSDAMRVYSETCDKGYDTACFKLGDMYFEGKGGNKNHTMAKKAYYKVCNKDTMANYEYTLCSDELSEILEKKLEKSFEKLLNNEDKIYIEKIKVSQKVWLKHRRTELEMFFPHKDDPKYNWSGFSSCYFDLKNELTMQRIGFLQMFEEHLNTMGCSSQVE